METVMDIPASENDDRKHLEVELAVVLNSVNVSSALIRDRVGNSKVPNLVKAVAKAAAIPFTPRLEPVTV